MRDNTKNRPDMAPGPRERRRRRELPRPSAMPCALPSSSPPLQSPCRATITLVSITRTPATLAAAYGSRRSPEKEAAPGSAAATRRLLVLDNVAAHPAGDRRSPQAPSDPLLQPPVSSSPAVDDDARGPCDRALIARLTCDVPFRWPSPADRWPPPSDGLLALDAKLTVGLHWEAKLMGRGAHTRMEPYVQTETYDLENGGSLVFERDLYLVSERLERPPPKFHGVRIHDTPTGEQQWMITADLKGSSEPPISERILFSFKACNWPDGLAHALQEGLARVCGQHIAALRGSRFAYFARHDTMGEPMAPSSHPVLMIHVQHLDLMLHETRKDLERTRVYNHRAQMTVAHHAEAIQMLAKDRKILRLQRAKKDATIRRLREKIRTLEVTVRTQQDQIQEMEEEGDDIQGGDDFLSDDNDFEDDEFTDEEDYEFLEAAEDGIIPIDVDEDDE
ncbi:hypothetical protein QYE76_031677 [Lolium multiflorum]|uniref:Uncharacterized protein n=1 Tax=Lolium multiflorum TaxID=4521 RepID=A0AAD8QU12_LOLMU|nr:hypothetical protein QYE76_031677 [Lolium multiflorum]